MYRVIYFNVLRYIYSKFLEILTNFGILKLPKFNNK